MNTRTARILAVAAAAISSLLYFLIGFEVLVVGESKTGTNDILGFGLVTGTTFAVIAILSALVQRRWLLGAIASLDALVIVGYFAFAGVREPAFEIWGLLVKAAQLVLLAGLSYLIFFAPTGRRAHVRPLTHAGGLR